MRCEASSRCCVALLRFALAGGLLWVVWRLRPGASGSRGASSRRLALLGFVSLTVYFTFENLGIARTSASPPRSSSRRSRSSWRAERVHAARAATRRGSGPASRCRSPASSPSSLGSGVAGGGVTGDLLVLAASFSAGLYSILARRLLVEPLGAVRHHVPEPVRGAVHGAPGAGRGGDRGGERPTPQAIGAVLYLAVACSMLAYLMLNYAFRFIEASRVSVFINLTPVVGVAGAYVAAGRALHRGAGAGGGGRGAAGCG